MQDRPKKCSDEWIGSKYEKWDNEACEPEADEEAEQYED